MKEPRELSGPDAIRVELASRTFATRRGPVQALAGLPEHQRETLWLYFSDGYTLLEISRRRKERLGNTRHHFYRGIQSLRKAIAASG